MSINLEKFGHNDLVISVCLALVPKVICAKHEGLQEQIFWVFYLYMSFLHGVRSKVNQFCKKKEH